MYLRTKMKFLGQCFQKLEPEQDKQTDRRDRTRYHAAFPSGKINIFMFNLWVIRNLWTQLPTKVYVCSITTT